MLLFGLWMIAIVGAEELTETVVVESQRNLASARARLDEAVRGLDYLPGVQVGARTVYMPRQTWEPPIVLWEDGRVRAHGHAITPYLITPQGRIYGFWGSRREGGATLAGWPERRAEIVEMWLYTADNDAGAGVRERIERFVDEEVQPTEPFTAAELADANTRRGFPGELAPAVP